MKIENETIDQVPSSKAHINLIGGNKVYIKVEHIDYGSFRVDSSTQIIFKLGSRSTYQKSNDSSYVSYRVPNHVWSLGYKDAMKALFIIGMSKYKFIGKNEEICEIELSLNGFHENHVTTHTFEMRTARFGTPPSIT